jgi:hypothetical protein
MALSKLKAIPLTLAQANHYVSLLHRHHKPCVGHRFSIGCMNDENNIVGVCIAGRPVSSSTNQEWVIEVSRLATDGTPNACSFLYGAAAKAAKALGYVSIQTFILESEPGTSLRASGWRNVSKTSKRGANFHIRPNKKDRAKRIVDTLGIKTKWVRELNNTDILSIKEMMVGYEDKEMNQWL